MDTLHLLPIDGARLVLLAEEDDLLRRFIADGVRRMGWDVAELRDDRDLEALLARHPSLAESALLVVDVREKSAARSALFAALPRARPRLPTIAISASDDDTVRIARTVGASMVFAAPFDVDDLCTALLFLSRAGQA